MILRDTRPLQSHLPHHSAVVLVLFVLGPKELGVGILHHLLSPRWWRAPRCPLHWSLNSSWVVSALESSWKLRGRAGGLFVLAALHLCLCIKLTGVHWSHFLWQPTSPGNWQSLLFAVALSTWIKLLVRRGNSSLKLLLKPSCLVVYIFAEMRAAPPNFTK